MKEQKIMAQMKGQDKTPEKQLNEVEIGNLPEKEFIIMIVKMIQDLRKTMKMQEMFTKDLQELKNKQMEMNNTREGINSRITKAEEWINDLGGRMVEITTSKQNIKNRLKKKNEDNLRDLWDKTKHMKMQKVMSQMKGQEKVPEKQLNEVEIGNLPKY